MSAFAIILDREGAPEADQVKTRLKEAYGSVYEYAPNVFMVSSSDALTADVARAGGFQGE